MADLPFDATQPVVVLVEALEILDPAGLQAYVAAIAPQMAQRGGRNIASGLHTYLGESDAITMVASYWPSAQSFLDWQASADYAPWGEKRKKSVRIRTHILPALPGAFG